MRWRRTWSSWPDCDRDSCRCCPSEFGPARSDRSSGSRIAPPWNYHSWRHAHNIQTRRKLVYGLKRFPNPRIFKMEQAKRFERGVKSRCGPGFNSSPANGGTRRRGTKPARRCPPRRRVSRKGLEILWLNFRDFPRGNNSPSCGARTAFMGLGLLLHHERQSRTMSYASIFRSTNLLASVGSYSVQHSSAFLRLIDSIPDRWNKILAAQP
jgi:hypothetical protein